MRFQSYINTALFVINGYDGKLPLSHYLKHYFSANKKHGSKDRKYITHLCYCYYRLGHALPNLEAGERIKAALFLCTNEAGEWSVLYDEEWISKWSTQLKNRIAFTAEKFPEFSAKQIFSFSNDTGESIDSTAFATSHLIQPDLFIRVRPGYEKTVKAKLTNENIPYHQLSETCIALPNASKIESVLDINKEVVIQDYSSQNIAAFFPQSTTNNQPSTKNNQTPTFSRELQTINYKLQTKLWDCCAASGGKSILAKDILGNIDLTVSDIRPSIIHNLKQRFKEAGIKNYHSFVADITQSSGNIQHAPFDLIICDAPCSGSGTWGRTPEQLYFFKEEKIKEYVTLQMKIVKNAVTYLVNDGYFLYITCSVFKQENEEVVDYIQQQLSLQLIKMEVLKGYDKKADTMFAALLQK